MEDRIPMIERVDEEGGDKMDFAFSKRESTLKPRASKSVKIVNERKVNFQCESSPHPGPSGLQKPQESKDIVKLFISSSEGHHDCLSTVSILLSCNADVNAVDNFGQTPICYAAGCGNLSLVKELVSHGASVNLPDNCESPSPVILAAEKLFIDVVKYLLVEISWQNLYHFACKKNTAALKLLHSLIPENMVIEDGMGNSVLHWAAQENNIAAIQQIIDCKLTDINVQNYNCETPLHLAARYGSLDAVKYLIKCGANLQAMDVNKRKPLSLALIWRHIEVAKFLDRYEKHFCSTENKRPKLLN